MIRFACPGCSATYTVGDEKGGKTGKCPKCQSSFTIPMPDAAASVPASTASAPSLPPVPPPPAGNDPVEIAPCPGCQARLSVSASDIGSDVECPYCKTVYKASKPGAPGSRAGGSSPRRKADDDDLDVVPKGRSVRSGDDDEDERPSRRRRRDDDDEDDRPSRRRSRDDDDDEAPRKRRRRSGGSYEPHRGVLILVLGILGWVGCGIFTAIPAWIMGSGDLKKMDAGEMDPEGRQMTQIGKILGMISVILTCVILLGYCAIFLIIGIGGAAAGGR